MAEQVRFTEGVSRLDGASLEAPFDLTDARLRERSGVRALSAPNQPGSDVPTSPPPKRIRIFRQSRWWREVRAAAQRGDLVYASKEVSGGSRFYTYQSTDETGTEEIPQVLSVSTSKSANPLASDYTQNRLVYYLLIPVNSRQEAGPWAWTAAEIDPSDEKFPALDIELNDAADQVEIYKSGFFKPDDAIAGATGLWRVGFASSSKTTSSGRAGTLFARNPTWSEEFVIDQTKTHGWYEQSSREDIYVSSKAWFVDPFFEDKENYPNRVSFDNQDPSDWQVQFEYLWDSDERKTGSFGGLDTNTRYSVLDAQQISGDWALRLDDGNGNPVSFDPSVLIEKEQTIFNDVFREGAKMSFFAPDYTGENDATFTFIDSDEWDLDYEDPTKKENQPNAPDTDALDRLPNVHAPTSASANQNGSWGASQSQSGIDSGIYDTFYYSGGVMYAGNPQWPTEPPQPAFVETGSGDRLRLQFEYDLGGTTVYGPVTEVPDVKRLAMKWHGLEDTLNIHARADVNYNITSVTINRDSVRVDDKIDRFTDLYSAGDSVTIQSSSNIDGTYTIDAIQSYDSGNDEQPFTVVEPLPADDSTGFIRNRTGNLAISNYSTGAGKATFIVSGDRRAYDNGEVEFDSNGNFYDIVGVTYDSNNNESEITSDDPSISSPSNADLRKDWEVNSADRKEDFVSVDDSSGKAAGEKAAGDTITIVNAGNANDGDHTLVSDPTRPNSSTTKFKVEGLEVDSTSGDVSIEQWNLYERLSADTFGTYRKDGSVWVWDATTNFPTVIQTRDTVQHSPRVAESDVVLMSKVNRPLELTFEQFQVPEGSNVRDLFRARLAEEEGIASYDFYVATGDAIYVAKPNVQDRSVQVRAVTTTFGIGVTRQGVPMRAVIPSGVILYGTDGYLHALSGRREERLLPDGLTPWGQGSLRDLAYHQTDHDLYVAEAEEVWIYDLQRQAIVGQYNINTDRLVWDERRSEMLCYDLSASAWKVLDETGSTLTAAVRTQEITQGGLETEIQSIQADYEKTGYDPTDTSTLATVEMTSRRSTQLVSDPLWRGHDQRVPLKGEGVQITVKDFDSLSELRISGIGEAD